MEWASQTWPSTTVQPLNPALERERQSLRVLEDLLPQLSHAIFYEGKSTEVILATKARRGCQPYDNIQNLSRTLQVKLVSCWAKFS